MNDFTERVEALKKKHEFLKTQHISMGATLTEKIRQREKVIAELAKLNVTPENLDDAITATEKELSVLVEQSEKRQAEIEAVYVENKKKLAELEATE